MVKARKAKLTWPLGSMWTSRQKWNDRGFSGLYCHLGGRSQPGRGQGKLAWDGSRRLSRHDALSVAVIVVFGDADIRCLNTDCAIFWLWNQNCAFALLRAGGRIPSHMLAVLCSSPPNVICIGTLLAAANCFRSQIDHPGDAIQQQRSL